jgi:PKD repeat protein
VLAIKYGIYSKISREVANMSTSNFPSKADPGRFLANKSTPESRREKGKCLEKTLKSLVNSKIFGLKMFCALVILLAVFHSVFAMAAAVTVSWDPNQEPDIAGYEVFYGTASRAYTESVTLSSPDQTSCEVDGLAGGYTYYFAVKAFDLGGQVSEYSNEVYRYIPLTNSPPNAAIQANTDHGTAPLEVLFDAGISSDPDGSIVEYTWSFGDGGSGAGMNAAHVYTTPGSYTVTLTVADNAGATDSTQMVIDVGANAAPVAVISAQPLAGKAPLAVEMNGEGSADSDGSIVSHSWDLGDGTAAEGYSISHVYNVAGTYTITLTVTDDKGSTGQTSVVVSAEANAAPEISGFSATPTILDNPNGKVTFETTVTDPEGDQLSYLLEFGNGDTATGLPATYRYKAAGIYEAVLTVTDSHNNQASSTITITVDDKRPNSPSNIKVVLSQ